MNVGIVTTWFERGAAYVSKQLEKTLSKENNVFIYARGGEKYAIGDPVWDKENVTWGKRSLFSGPTSINRRDFIKWLNFNKIELVIFNEQHDWKPLSICHDLNIKIGAYIDYYKKETVPFFGSYDFLICNTKRHYSVFDWHPQALYIPWGTDISIYSPASNNKKIFTFFHSAGLNPLRKGTDILLKAAYKLKQNKIKIVIHTQSNLSFFFPELKNVITELENEGKLEIINKTIGAPGLYHLGDVYVYPSRLDGIGLTIAEAISCGLPAIVTDEQPMNEFIKSPEGGTTITVIERIKRNDGYYWPQAIVDVEDLAIKMKEFYTKGNKQGLQEKARQYAEKYLDWDQNSRSLNSNLLKIKLISRSYKKKALNQAIAYDNSVPIIQKVRSLRIYKKSRALILEILYQIENR